MCLQTQGTTVTTTNAEWRRASWWEAPLRLAAVPPCPKLNQSLTFPVLRCLVLSPSLSLFSLLLCFAFQAPFPSAMSISMIGPVPVPKPQTSPLSIVITGASRGLGYELVVQYAKAHKDNIVIAGVRDPAVASVKNLAAYPNVHVVQLDVANESSIKASVKVVERFTQHVDLLVNNAGIFGAAESANAVVATASQMVEVFQVNVVGVVLTTQAYLPLLHKSSTAKVFNHQQWDGLQCSCQRLR